MQPKDLYNPSPRYSQGILVEAGKLLFIAGQTALDEKGEIVGKGDFEKQAHKVFENIQSILKEVGASFGNVTKITIYVTDIKYLQPLSAIRVQYFGVMPPASTFVVVESLAHEEFFIEIEAIAVVP